MRHSLLLFVAIIGIACAGGNRSAGVTTVTAAAADDVQTQSTATTVQSFTPVEGADLMARLEAAQSRARARQTPYWSAYTFDVRPGVAVDPGIRDFHGSMNTMGDTTVFIGTTSAGVTVETRDLAIFLLRDPSSNQITRMEVYNLERKREYSGYPVYWLGRANNEESLNYLRAIAAATPLDMLSERAVLAIALHDDARVAGMLKNFISTSPNQRIRSSSVYWLGQVGGEQTFLASLVRNEAEDMKLRRSAAHAIGQNRDRGAINTLQDLYRSVKEVELRRSVISAAGNSVDEQAAFTFLLSVAKQDADAESRRVAVRQLGHFKREDAVEELMKFARADANVDVRKSAIRALSERGEAAVDNLLKLYDSETVPDVKRTVLQSLSEIKSTRVEDKLFEVARSSDNVDVKRQA